MIDFEKFINEEMNEDYMKNIVLLIQKERAAGKVILPLNNNIFRIFREANGLNIDVVILGQDPYPKSKDACGLAFSVERDEKLPGSLKNIFKEIYSDIGVLNKSGNLLPWVKEGIFLLNTRLTVEEGKPLSHKNIGWNIFIDKVLKRIVDDNPDCIFLLFGNEAHKYEVYAKPENVIKTVHPSPLSVNRGFFGSKPFSAVNNRLVELGKNPKSWKT